MMLLDSYRDFDQTVRRWWWGRVLALGLLLTTAAQFCYRKAGGFDISQRVRDLEAQLRERNDIITLMCDEKRMLTESNALLREMHDTCMQQRLVSARTNGELRAENRILIEQSAKRGALLAYMVSHLAIRLPRHLRQRYHEADVTPPRVPKRTLATLLDDAKGTSAKAVKSLKGRKR